MTTCLPPEWAPQHGTLIVWPHPRHDWAESLSRIEPVYLTLAEQITKVQHLYILCQDEPHRDQLRQKLAAALPHTGRISLITCPGNDTWIRDNGPLTVRDHRQHWQWLDFRFNGWGNKFDATLDDRVTETLHHSEPFCHLPLQHLDFILEGGSIEVDGAGTMLTTTQCLLAPTRNPGCSRRDISRLFARTLGVHEILWLENSFLLGDDTDGHIDMLVRFCSPDVVCYCHCRDPEDPHFRPLGELARELALANRRRRRPWQLLPLPLPDPQVTSTGQRLPASYANFSIINQTVLIPVYNTPSDSEAIALLTQAFPRHRVQPVDARPLIEQGGAVHCATMQIPAIFG